MKNKVLLILFVTSIIAVTILKSMFVCDLPIVANIGLGVDDALMIDITKHLSNGQWVGNYGDVIISKGLTFPFLLLASYNLGIDYITMMTVIYSLACLVLILVLSKRIKNKFMLFLIYVITLFVPIMYSYQVMQRIYRNALIPSFAILIISGYMYLLFSRNEEKSFWKRFLASLLTGFVLALFWYTREDSIWMIPYIAFMSLSILIATIVKNKKISKELLINILLLIIPIIMIFGYRHIICTQNEKHFGVYTVYNNESYNKAMKSLKKVKKYDYYDNIDYTVAKLKKVSEVSCLDEIYGTLEGLVYGYSLFDSSPEEGEVANGWFPWALKSALNQHGYYSTAQNINNFFDELHYDIEAALADGRLEYEDVKPDLKTQITKVFKAAYLTFKAVLKYEDIYFRVEPSEYKQQDKEAYLNFYKYTGNHFFVQNVESKEEVNLTNNPDNYKEIVNKKADIIEKLINIYKVLNLITFVLAIVLYIIFSIIVFVGLFKKNLSRFEMWAVISGVLGAMLTLIMGIAYETAFNAYVITAMYLSAVYSLMLIFSMLMIGQFIKIIVEKVKEKKEINQEVTVKENA